MLLGLMFLGLFIVTGSEHLFEGLLQRRAKPIQWKWSQDLTKSTDKESQRQRRFLQDETDTVVKWWEEMPQKVSETRDNSDTYFGKYSLSKRNQLAKVLRAGTRLNKTELLKEENIHHELHNFYSLSDFISPFEKQIDPKDHLSPTERTILISNHALSSLNGFDNVSQEREQENQANFQDENIPALHDIPSEILKEAIIQERHRPSTFEKQTATQHLDSENTHKENNVFGQVKPSVEYVASSVEHILPEVVYVEHNFKERKPTIPSVLPSVDYISSNVELVEPEINYEEKRNNTEVEESPKKEKTPTESEIFIKGWPNKPPDHYDYKTVRDGAIYQIVGPRREQIRVRRNYARSLQLGLPDVDYPTLEALPVLQFYCGDYLPGYYVDITTKCQVFHICDENGQRSSFLCPVGTLFNQEYLVCDWWYNVDCQSSIVYYRTDALQAYSTMNDNQRMLSKFSLLRDSGNSELQEPNLEFSEKSRTKNLKQTRTSQKGIYPIGYAILLREYMKNSDIFKKNYSIPWNENYEWDDDETNTKILYSGDFLTKQEKLENEAMKIRHHQPLIDKLKNNFFHSNAHKYPTADEHNFRSHQLNKDQEYRQNHNRLHSKDEIGQNQKAAHEFDFENSTKSKTDFYASHFKGTSHIYEKQDEREREIPLFVLQNQKIFETKAGNETILPTAKPGRNKINLNKYHFIINPKEVIIPAKTQYAEIQRHFKSNDSFIKFKQGKSIIKHISPKNNQFTSYPRPSSDELPQNSESSRLKTTRPRGGYHYGDRISVKSRSVLENIENLYLKENQGNLYSVPLTKLTNFQKNIENSRHTDDSLPLASQNQLKVMPLNTASNMFINNYKAEKEKSFNKTQPFPPKVGNTDNEFLSDKRKITISVQIEQKKVLMEDVSQNISKKLNYSQQKKMTRVPLILNSPPAQKPLKDLFSNMPRPDKTKYPLRMNSTHSKPKNSAGTRNDFGGYSFMKILNGAFRTSHEGREESQLYPVYMPQSGRKKQNSTIMPTMND